MSEVSRRRFLARASLGAGVAVAAAALPRSAVAQTAPNTGDSALSVDPQQAAAAAGLTLREPMVVHVRDVATAEIAVLVGTQEFVYRDPALVAQLVRAARQAAGTEG
jgi:hypothetical protein